MPFACLWRPTQTISPLVSDRELPGPEPSESIARSPDPRMPPVARPTRTRTGRRSGCRAAKVGSDSYRAPVCLPETTQSQRDTTACNARRLARRVTRTGWTLAALPPLGHEALHAAVTRG